MARQDVLCLLCCLSLLTCELLSRAYATRVPVVYDEYGLENEKICNPSNFRKKKTMDIGSTAVIVKPKYMFNRWSVLYDVHCKFVFKAAKGDGLFGVIQKMYFRRNETGCIDYVQFKRKDNHRTEKFCGYLNRSRVKYSPMPEPDTVVYNAETHSPITYAEYDPSESKSGGELETEIFISKEKLHQGEQLALSIAYTPYKSCNATDMSVYKPIGYNMCMREAFFCDGVYNCIPHVKFFCSDEADCPSDSNEVVGTGAGTNVTVGAVTTMILCFVIFVMCLWICKRSQKLCWSSDCAGPTVCSRPGTLPRDPDTAANRPVPTAPMLEVAVTPSVADKDLPPSYDSLFPEQSAPARS